MSLNILVCWSFMLSAIIAVTMFIVTNHLSSEINRQKEEIEELKEKIKKREKERKVIETKV